jgi:hypothetical protein
LEVVGMETRGCAMGPFGAEGLDLGPGLEEFLGSASLVDQPARAWDAVRRRAMTTAATTNHTGSRK